MMHVLYTFNNGEQQRCTIPLNLPLSFIDTLLFAGTIVSIEIEKVKVLTN
jgi:hypothetical protein